MNSTEALRNQYRKKPVMVEAMQWRGPQIGAVDYGVEFDAWMVAHGGAGNARYVGSDVHLTTIHGETAIARPGDWVVREPKPGCFYPVKPEIFAATYDLALTAPLDEKYAEIQRRHDDLIANPDAGHRFYKAWADCHNDRATLLDAIRVVTAEKVEINNTLQMLKSAFALETKELLAARARAETAEAELNVLRSNLGLPQMKWVDDHFEPILEPTPKPQPSVVVFMPPSPETLADAAKALSQYGRPGAAFPTLQHTTVLPANSRGLSGLDWGPEHTTVGPGLTEEERAHYARIKETNAECVQPSKSIELLCQWLDRLLGEAAEEKK